MSPNLEISESEGKKEESNQLSALLERSILIC